MESIEMTTYLKRFKSIKKPKYNNYFLLEHTYSILKCLILHILPTKKNSQKHSRICDEKKKDVWNREEEKYEKVNIRFSIFL